MGGRNSPGMRYCGITVSLVLLVVSISLVAVHSSNKCIYSENGTNWQECEDDLGIFCVMPAIDSHGTFSYFGKTVDVQLSCSWQKGVSVLSTISLAFSITFLILISTTPRIKSLGLSVLILVSGLIAVLALLTTFIFMIVNIVKGSKTAQDDWKKPGAELIYTQWSYIITALLVCFACAILTSLTISEFKLVKREENESLLNNRIDDQNQM